MRKKIIGILICMLLTCSIASSISVTELEERVLKITHQGRTLFVGGYGPGNYSTIQEAIDNASDGDTIFVYSHMMPYYENVNVTKSINLLGENKSTTVIDGMRKSHVIHIKVDKVYIRGFTIQNSSLESGTAYSGIFSEQREHIYIEQNIIRKNFMGITFYYSDNCNVSNNTIKSNKAYGIYAWGGDTDPCNNLTYTGNEITNNDNSGIWCVNSLNSVITYNIMRKNGEGLDMQWHSNNSLIANNIISNNYFYGFWLVYTGNCTIRNNLIKDNGWEELCIYEHEQGTHDSNNTIYHNTIVDGLLGCWDDGSNEWDSGYPSCGNYYNDYTGEDNYSGPKQDIPGSDGIGDTPHKITGGSNKDRYPLIYPMGENPPMANYTYKLKNFTIRLDGSISLDRDGTVESYDWDFGDSTSGSGKKTTHTYSKPGKYKIELNVTDDDDKQGNWSWPSFKVPNQPPYAPRDPEPSNGATNIDVNAGLSWKCSGDPEGEPVSFNVYFEANDSTPDVLVSENQTLKSHIPGKMNYTTQYYWRIVVWDIWGASTHGPVWNFTTEVNAPPNAPKNPEPPDGSSNIDINADITWQCGDPDGDDLTFNVYFEANDSTPDVLVSENQTNFTYDPGKMNYTTQYFWRIVAFDNSGASTSGSIWDFTTRANAPPYSPHSPEPPDGATNIDVNASLNWNCTDPDGDEITYDVYFGKNSSPLKVSNNQSENWYDPGTMNYSTKYYWRIVAWDSYGQSASGRIWSFTTGSLPNNPPYEPSDPDPKSGSTNIDIDADLSWTGGDPDLGDTVVYDVYLEADDSTPDIQVADDINETTFDPGILEYETIYYWRVIAKDNHGASTYGYVWRFTTESAPEPDLSCEGTLNWVDVEPGSTVNGSFTVENKGEPLSLLDWKVSDWPKDWGNNWQFIPMSGDNFKPSDGPITINISVVAPSKKNSEFTGEVKIINLENNSDICTIDVHLATPKSKLFFYNFPLINWLLDRFPILYRLLDVLKVNLGSSCLG